MIDDLFIPDPPVGDSSNQIANTRFVTNAVASAVATLAQYISSSVVKASVMSVTTNVIINVTSIALPPGGWDISFIPAFTGAPTTTVTYWNASISTTSATLDLTPGRVGQAGLATAGAIYANNDITIPTGPARFSLIATTTFYGVAQTGFAVSTSGVYGILSGRRV